eukprot:TRINITY_DN4433_c0_g1_i1.p1 TRINITY_DN4433_c0_g1~~TRINITY_DN4433_c0_g1_i1.p1  ORF type:complete len:632 (-),score=67.58 TRINITY_DN4433_c0_g1_i1:64-1959(-)
MVVKADIIKKTTDGIYVDIKIDDLPSNNGILVPHIELDERTSKLNEGHKNLPFYVHHLNQAKKQIFLTLGRVSVSKFMAQRLLTLREVKPGIERLAIVKTVMNYGVFLDLGVADENNREYDASNPYTWSRKRINGLLYKYDDAKDPERKNPLFSPFLFSPGRCTTVCVKSVDYKQKKISLDIIPGKTTEDLDFISLGPQFNLKSQKKVELENEHTGETDKGKEERNMFDILVPDAIQHIFTFLSKETLTLVISNTCKLFERLVNDGALFDWESNEIICYHTKNHFTEDILGVGLNLERYPNSNKLAYITCTFDLVSYQAFLLEKVRRAAYKEYFTHWMPLYINKAHAAQSMGLIQKSISLICSGNENKFHPLMVLEVLPKLMNSMVVSMMSGKLYASIMALEGYSAFHHLFLAFVEEYPVIRQQANKLIKQFIEKEKHRHKTEIPSLGEWLPLLTITEKYSWDDVAESYLLEMFDRNALWILVAYPSHQFRISTTQRLSEAFEATKVSNRLILFHHYFLKYVARPPGISPSKVKSMLDSRYGRPTYKMKDKLVEECKILLNLKTWGEFFSKLDITIPKEKTLSDWLYNCVKNSEQKNYHNEEKLKLMIEEKRRQERENDVVQSLTSRHTYY